MLVLSTNFSQSYKKNYKMQQGKVQASICNDVFLDTDLHLEHELQWEWALLPNVEQSLFQATSVKLHYFIL